MNQQQSVLHYCQQGLPQSHHIRSPYLCSANWWISTLKISLLSRAKFEKYGVQILPPKLYITKCKPKRTKTAPQAILLNQQSFSPVQLLEQLHKQHGWGKGRRQQNQQVFQDLDLNINTVSDTYYQSQNKFHLAFISVDTSPCCLILAAKVSLDIVHKWICSCFLSLQMSSYQGLVILDSSRLFSDYSSNIFSVATGMDGNSNQIQMHGQSR